jgi:hypothetical protein
MTDPDNGGKPGKKYKILEILRKLVFWPEYTGKPEFVSDVDDPYIKKDWNLLFAFSIAKERGIGIKNVYYNIL